MGISGWVAAVAAAISSATAVASFVFSLTSRRRSNTAKENADKASFALADIEKQRNLFLENMDKRETVREGAQPWEITQELNSGFRARNKLNVPLFNVDISASGPQIAEKETPLDKVQDGESFTFVAFSFMQTADRRVTISYSMEPDGEIKTFSEPLPPELVKR